MISEKTAAYIPFERILEENAMLVFRTLEEAEYEATEVKDPFFWLSFLGRLCPGA
ncbi:MAG: hypothetical protein O6943_00310 [Bacteroidetes bacterium]|nr:hypothetical protein [Bacteroidota bacterium]